MKRVTFFLLIILSTVNLLSQTNFRTVASMDEFRQKLKLASASVHTIESSFTQQKYMSSLSEKIVSEGQFYYSKPDKICLHYHTPVNYLITINGKKIKIEADGKKNVYDIGSNKMMGQVNILLSACMTGDLNSLSADYTLELQENDTHYYIKIFPKSSVKTYLKEIDMYLNKKDMAVRQLRLTEPSGDYTQYQFTNQKRNVIIANETFTIK